jgi:hypothetical protein
MNYHGLVKSLDLPAGWVLPTDLAYDDVRAHAISRADLAAAVRPRWHCWPSTIGKSEMRKVVAAEYIS